MRNVIEFKGKNKRKPVIRGKEQEAVGIDTKVAMIQALIPIALEYVEEELTQEVERLAGERYSREEGEAENARWGSQKGSVYLGEQRVRIDVPRVRDMKKNREVPLSVYQKLQQPRQADSGLMLRVLRGLSCRSYEACAEAMPEAFGLSPSSVSRRFILASARKLSALQERDLSRFDLVAIFFDGKAYGDDEIILAVGVTLGGKKVILGMVQASSENEVVCRDFIRGMIDRGLGYRQGLLCVIDGSKGIKAAISSVFGYFAKIQRCQWHKRENIVKYVGLLQQKTLREKLRRAYAKSTYDAAKGALLQIRRELEPINISAVSSLDEGLEETLTLHRMGLFEALGQSFKTTNCIESIHAQMGQRTDKVDYWRNSSQKQRWVAAALLDIEPSLRTVKGYRSLPFLRAKLQETIQKEETKRNTQKAL